MYSDKTINIDDVAAVDVTIEAFLADRIKRSIEMSPHYQDLWQDIARMLRAGGKRIRSRTLMMSYRMFGGTDTKAVAPAAVALELLHQGMLMHDDIIDRDLVRYGVDNIAGGYKKRYKSLLQDDSSSEHYAASAALLAGDLLLSAAYELMAECRVDAVKILEIHKVLGGSIYETIGGELLDTESAFRPLDSASAEMIARHKTANYTVMLPMLVGATLAGAPSNVHEELKNFSISLGVAFQLRDDLLGVFGDHEKTGKTTTGDIREGKHTYMIEQFQLLATKEQREEFAGYFGNQMISSDGIERARSLLVASGAYSQTEKTIENYSSIARTSASKLLGTKSSLDELEQLIVAATRRSE